MMNFRLSDLTEDPVINEAFSSTREWLTAFATDETVVQKLSVAFGDRFDTTKLNYLLSQWASRNFIDVPAIELLPRTEINQANGAFAAQTNAIYLSQEYVSRNAKNTRAIANVLLEEIGHFIDSQINTLDSPGDEGAIFSALTQGIYLDQVTLQALKAEDDSAVVVLNGQVIQIEQNSLSGVPVTDVPDLFSLPGLLAVAGVAGPVAGAILAIADPTAGWIWVDPNEKYKSVTGTVTESFVTHSDFPVVHDSHDQNTHIRVDPAYDNLLSIINDPGEIEVEWETGIRPFEHGGDGANPIFPKWVWPSVGDRVWVEGNWIYDAGHPKDVDGITRYNSEIHPPRAFATMRDQVMPMPNTGSVPVHATATDLYIHGDGGYATEVLNNSSLVANGGHDIRTSPIDVDFDFDILLPSKPSDTAIYTWSITDGPANTINIAPILTPNLLNNSVHVHIPLAGSGISPSEVYARHINVGWAYPTTDLHHLRVTLTKMILHNDQDPPGADGELTFSWLNLNKSGSNAWQRLSDFDIPTRDYDGVEIPGSGILPGGPYYVPGFKPHVNTLEDYDDTNLQGSGELNFTGPIFDFYVANNESVSIKAHAYDQDAFDLNNLFGNHDSFISQIPAYGAAVLDPLETLDNDLYNVLETTLNASDNYRVGEFRVSNPGNEYEMIFRVEEIPLKPDEVNKSPVAVIKGSYSVAEGSTITLSSEGSYDPDGSITSLQWDLNGDGKFDDAVAASPIFSATALDGPASRPIALRIIDNLGVATIANSTINITNVPPTSFISGDFVGVPGLSRNFILSATDPSDADTAAGFTFEINFGDGTNQTLFPIDPLKIQHIFSTYGTKTITVTATDKDGGVSKAVTHQIDIKAAALIPDPTNPTLTDLVVGGTPGDDLITVTQQGETGNYRVIINNEFKGDFSPTRRIIVYGIEGQDRIIVPNSRLPVEMFGGDGSDELDGGFGDIAMFGGKGNDFYKVDSVNDRVIEYPDQGLIDTVNASIDYLLGANLENLNLLEGTAAFTGIGNELSNTINGNSYNNYIDGGDGSDTLYGYAGSDTILGGNGDDKIIGGQGADILTGGSGKDSFIYNSITDAGDRITDFTIGSDKIVLNNIDKILLPQVVNSSGWRSSNLFTDGFLTAQQASNGMTTLLIDPDGRAGRTYFPAPFILFNNVSAAALGNMSNFVV